MTVDEPPVPHPERGPYRRPTDITLLAVLERARKHTDHPTKSELAAFLGARYSGAAGRSLEEQLQRLRSKSLVRVEPGYRSGFSEEWFLTDLGTDRLDLFRSEVGPLPDSPEHAQWRLARGLAAEQFDELEEGARVALRDALEMLAGKGAEELGTAEIADIMASLRWRLARLGVAIYCLGDWPEPDDDVKDPRPEGLDEYFARHLKLLNTDEEHPWRWGRDLRDL